MPRPEPLSPASGNRFVEALHVRQGPTEHAVILPVAVIQPGKARRYLVCRHATPKDGCPEDGRQREKTGRIERALEKVERVRQQACGPRLLTGKPINEVTHLG